MVRMGVEQAYGGPLRVGLGPSPGQLAASFAGPGLLAGASSLAAMLGADLGTAIAAQILSLNISWAAPLLILVGFVLFQRSTGRRPRSLAWVLLGLGLIFLALSMIVRLADPIHEASLTLQTVDALGANLGLALPALGVT